MNGCLKSLQPTCQISKSNENILRTALYVNVFCTKFLLIFPAVIVPISFSSHSTLSSEKGIVVFEVPHEFRLSLSVVGDDLKLPWRLVNLEVLVGAGLPGGPPLCHSQQTRYLTQLAQSHLVAAEAPLAHVFTVLHTFCLSLVLDCLHTQVLSSSLPLYHACTFTILITFMYISVCSFLPLPSPLSLSHHTSLSISYSTLFYFPHSPLVLSPFCFLLPFIPCPSQLTQIVSFRHFYLPSLFSFPPPNSFRHLQAGQMSAMVAGGHVRIDEYQLGQTLRLGYWLPNTLSPLPATGVVCDT